MNQNSTWEISLSVLIQIIKVNQFKNSIKKLIKIKKKEDDIIEKKLLDPKIDYVFKRISGKVGNEEITTALIQAITKIKISNLELDNSTILEGDLIDDKIGILDIKGKIDNNISCNIEMQVLDRKNVEKRIMFYWSKQYTTNINRGQDYNKLEKTICILIVDYELKKLEKVPKYITKWNIREEDYGKIILTDVLELYIIELPKFTRYSGEEKYAELDEWIKFIKDPEVIDMENTNKEVKKAKEVLEEISQDEHERYLTELRQKYILDQKAIEDAGYDKRVW